MERLLVVWAGDVDLGLDYRSSKAYTYMLGTHVVSLSTGEIELPKKNSEYSIEYTAIPVNEQQKG